MKRTWNQYNAMEFLQRRGVEIRDKFIYNWSRIGNTGGGAFDYLINYCGYKAAGR